MSLYAYRIAWSLAPLGVSGHDLNIALALADAADGEGVCWPSGQTLATKTGMSLRRVRMALAELERIGAVEIDAGGGRGKCNRYRLRLPRQQGSGGPDGGGGRAPEPPKGGLFDTVNGAGRAPLETGGGAENGAWHAPFSPVDNPPGESGQAPVYGMTGARSQDAGDPETVQGTTVNGAQFAPQSIKNHTLQERHARAADAPVDNLRPVMGRVIGQISASGERSSRHEHGEAEPSRLLGKGG